MEIEDFFNTYQHAAWTKDATTMIHLYHTDAVIFDMWDQGYHSSSEWSNAIMDWLGSLGEENVKVEFERVQIHQSGNVGFATALILFQAVSSEGTVLRSMKNRISLGFSKFEDGWKVTHQHTSAPIRSDGLTAILDI
jgi:ketosteroid isomerase-like protein